MVSEQHMENLSSSISNSASSSSLLSTSESMVFLTMPIAIKLTNSNYLSWQSQIIPILHGYDLYKFVHLTSAPPSPTSVNSNGVLEFNPLYLHWHKQDQVLLGWLRSSLSEPILAQMVSCSTSAQLWSALQRSFSSTSRARLTELRRNLLNTSKGSSSCSDYISRVRSTTDELSFVGHSVSDDDLVMYLLNGLGSDFTSFVASINARSEPVNSHDLFSLLLTHEQLLQTHHLASMAPPAPAPLPLPSLFTLSPRLDSRTRILLNPSSLGTISRLTLDRPSLIMGRLPLISSPSPTSPMPLIIEVLVYFLCPQHRPVINRNRILPEMKSVKFAQRRVILLPFAIIASTQVMVCWLNLPFKHM